MNVRRVLLKLRYDGPGIAVHRLANRLSRKMATRGQRARWGDGQARSSVGSVVEGFSPRHATRLWPGAADRSWLVDAPCRWPELHRDAIRRAEAASAGRFDLLGSGEVNVLDSAGRIRWHEDFKSGATFPADCLYLDVPITLPQEGTDIKVPWELSRFQQVFAWLWTDPDRYGPVFLRQWEDWIEANPLARGVNWACAMDVALRAISWTAAVAAWGDTWDRKTLDRMGGSLADHGRFIRDNLEWVYGHRTNHYFSDITGLAVLGAVLAPHPPAVEWSIFAARELRREILAQFAPDGFDKEGSTAYHRLMVELATLALLACRIAGHDLGEPVRQRLIAAYRAIAILTDSAGNGPLIADNDSGRVFPMAWREDTQMDWILPLGAEGLDEPALALGPAPPEAVLLLGTELLRKTDGASRSTGFGTASTEPCGTALRDSGFFVLGNRDSHLIVRCGPLAYEPTGSHQHLDQLSITLTVAGRQLLVDPGQFCYTPWPRWRDTFRLTAAHNSLTVDGEPECRMFTMGRMAFSIINEARPALLDWQITPEGALFVGRHSGYRRLPGGGDVTRTIQYEAGTRRWTISDQLALAGRHRVEWRLHLHPEARAERDGDAWRLRREQNQVVLQWAAGGTAEAFIEDGWHAPAYGVKLAAPVLVFRLESEAPVETTIIVEAQER